jgi:hypothetical protein
MERAGRLGHGKALFPGLHHIDLAH